MKKVLLDAIAAALIGVALFVALFTAYNIFPGERPAAAKTLTQCEALAGGQLRFDGEPACQTVAPIPTEAPPHGDIGTAAVAVATPTPAPKTVAPSAIVSEPTPTARPVYTTGPGWICTMPPPPLIGYCYKPISPSPPFASSARTNP